MTTDKDSQMTIEQLQKTVDEWINTIGVKYFSPLTNMAILTEETGEVARIMARKFGDQSFKPGEKQDLADELADLIWVAVAIANQTGVNLTTAITDNIAKKNSPRCQPTQKQP